MYHYDLFNEVLNGIKDGMSITFTPYNIAVGDRFLIFNKNRTKQKITFHTKCVPYRIDFDGEEPMRLEDVPASFLSSILLNLPKM